MALQKLRSPKIRRLSVVDQVSDSIKQRLFREMVTSKGSKGTGLGLYISNAIVRGILWRQPPKRADGLAKTQHAGPH